MPVLAAIFLAHFEIVFKGVNLFWRKGVSLAGIYTRGTSDALYNANTIGLYDAFGGNHLNSYDDPYEQQAYLKGRLGGDAIATAQSAAEINVGGGVALSTGIETVGVGAAAGGALALHGAGMGATAAADAGWSLKKLYQLNISTTAASDVGSTPKKYESPTNVSKQTQTNSTTLWKGKGKERIDVENPNPSQREGQIHYQDNKGGKFLYDIKTNTFRGVSKSVNKMLNSSVIKNAIKKGLKYLGH